MPPPTVHFCLLGPSETPIGGYKVVYEYANALVAEGVAVTVWHSSAFSGAVPWWGVPRRVMYSLADWWLLGHRRVWRRNGISWFDIDPRVNVRATGGIPRVRATRGDVVVGTAIETNARVGRYARHRGARSATLIQHFETWAATPLRIWRAWNDVDVRIVIAPWLAEEVAAAGLDSHLLLNAVRTDLFPLGPPLLSRKNVVVSLLSPHGYKRPDVVVAALESVVRRRPDVAVAAFGQTAEPPLASRSITYHPDPSPRELQNLYRSARVYLCASDAEGWHLPASEATLSGAAVVSTDIRGIRDSIGDEALYAPPGDPEGLAEQVLAVLDDLNAAQERADRARSRLLETTYEGNVRELLRILWP